MRGLQYSKASLQASSGSCRAAYLGTDSRVLWRCWTAVSVTAGQTRQEEARGHLPTQPVARVKLAPLTGTSRPPRGVGSRSLAKEYRE